MILMSSSAQAFEPITTVLGIVGGPLFCKMITCKSTETNTIYVQQPMDPKTVARIEKMKADFKWDTEFCRLSPICLLYTSPSPRDKRQSRMPSSA